MSRFNVKLKRNALLEQANDLLKRENAMLRERILYAESLLSSTEEQVKDEENRSDEKTLCERREFLEDQTKAELSNHTNLTRDKVATRFASCGLTNLHCYLRDLQLLKMNMAEAELACVVSDLWNLKVDNYEDRLKRLCDCIDRELDNCPSDLNPFVAEAINRVVG